MNQIRPETVEYIYINNRNPDPSLKIPGSGSATLFLSIFIGSQLQPRSVSIQTTVRPNNISGVYVCICTRDGERERVRERERERKREREGKRKMYKDI